MKVAPKKKTLKTYTYFIPTGMPCYQSEGKTHNIPQFGGMCEFGTYREYSTWRLIVWKNNKRCVKEAAAFTEEEYQKFKENNPCLIFEDDCNQCKCLWKCFSKCHS